MEQSAATSQVELFWITGSCQSLKGLQKDFAGDSPEQSKPTINLVDCVVGPPEVFTSENIHVVGTESVAVTKRCKAENNKGS